jgi:hypothetical protein
MLALQRYINILILAYFFVIKQGNRTKISNSSKIVTTMAFGRHFQRRCSPGKGRAGSPEFVLAP